MNYDKQHIEDLTNSIKEFTEAHDKAVSTFSKISSPELKNEMSKGQKVFMARCEKAFENRDGDMSSKMEELQKLMDMGKNIV